LLTGKGFTVDGKKYWGGSGKKGLPGGKVRGNRQRITKGNMAVEYKGGGKAEAQEHRIIWGRRFKKPPHHHPKRECERFLNEKSSKHYVKA